MQFVVQNRKRLLSKQLSIQRLNKLYDRSISQRDKVRFPRAVG